MNVSITLLHVEAPPKHLLTLNVAGETMKLHRFHLELQTYSIGRYYGRMRYFCNLLAPYDVASPFARWMDRVKEMASSHTIPLSSVKHDIEIEVMGAKLLLKGVFPEETEPVQVDSDRPLLQLKLSLDHAEFKD